MTCHNHRRIERARGDAWAALGELARALEAADAAAARVAALRLPANGLATVNDEMLQSDIEAIRAVVKDAPSYRWPLQVAREFVTSILPSDYYRNTD